MAFTENSDPIEDLQIGTIEVSSSKKELKKLSVETLNKIYDRIHNKREANVIVDDIHYNKLSYFDQRNLNNNVVDAINYLHNIKRRDNARALNLKRGDVIKVTIRGNVYKAYVQFSKTGILKTDSRGRIIALTVHGSKIKVIYNNISIVKGKEKAEFIKEYNIP
jgi:hypothetical protein